MRQFLLLLLFIATFAHAGEIPPYQPRFDRARPVIAVIGNSTSTEITDFMLPYGVLKRAGAADILAVATEPGWIKMNTGLRIKPDLDLATFDRLYPQGADYVIVPAMAHDDAPPMLSWLAAQGAKGATVVSICDGALVVANSGLLKGHRGTAHWATHELRVEKYPATTWLSNVRYVADGKVVSSAGISAAMPTSLALVEAIAGHDRAAAVASDVGVQDWSTQHDSGVYAPKFGRNLNIWLTHFTDSWFHRAKPVGLPVANGVDEIALAYTSDAYARSRRNKVLFVAANTAPVTSRFGLAIEPDHIAGTAGAPDDMLEAPDNVAAGKVLDKVLARIADNYGPRTAKRIAMEFEYPGFR
ncbi:DJ-1/PfpI family protein [Pseudoduganella ginsengisoli]|uniref:Transcriptional regulator n=1 Tax=Pseudoduganella ginsengisoli TaxID=1462440 RepID=A0A6L6Q5L5_9BURK|nr:DJ-1/PfpI family protein [Pseudoduganella ginsengisoli]MTW04786.1 transcriptional regulator [Pseudoduganella ginsengisoli]